MVETLFISSGLYITYLAAETYFLRRSRGKIPLRIAVTGTRGKSTLVRMLASVLNEAGHTVAAKTTGTRAQLSLPGSDWHDIRRHGLPSIIEQKKIIRLAAKHGSQTLVCEIMSIQRENHFVEARKLLAPHLVIITNIGIDHTEVMGKSKEETASVLMETLCPGAQIFIPQEEVQDQIMTSIQAHGGTMNAVSTGLVKNSPSITADLRMKFFPRLLDLVLAVASFLKISEKSVVEGLRRVSLDEGAFKIWTYRDDKRNKTFYLVNGFAANEPDSTYALLQKARHLIPEETKEIAAIINLRTDRGDRTLQWLQDLNTDRWDCLTTIYPLGPQCSIFKRKLPARNITLLKSRSARGIMEEVTGGCSKVSIIIGMGNFKGRGSQLVNLWQKKGVELGY